MSFGDIDQMRSFIYLAESLKPVDDEEALTESVSPEAYMTYVDTMSPVVREDLEALVEKMRAFMETEGEGEFALGVETGMQRAADMIENLIRRHLGGDQSGS